MTMHFSKPISISALGLCVGVLGAQPGALKSPEVTGPGQVVLRVSAPRAMEVRLADGTLSRAAREAGKEKLFSREDDGTWKLVLTGLPFDIYNYHLMIDGVRALDPSNPHVQLNAGPPNSEVTVTDGHQYYDPLRVPHGTISRHAYHSQVIGGAREIYIYTPPQYSAGDQETRYPVLYLYGGNGQLAHSWFTTGRLPWIADNLLADHRMVPMIVVMCDSHPTPLSDVLAHREEDVVSSGDRSLRLIEAELLKEIIPFVDANFCTWTDGPSRAIAGMSRGAAVAETVGLSQRQLFSWIGIFSGGGHDFSSRHAALLENPEASNREIKLLFLGSGKSDQRPLATLTALHTLLDKRGLKHKFWTDSPEAHNWCAWRPMLARGFLPLLFRSTAK